MYMNKLNDINGVGQGVPVSKSRKQILQELLDLENKNVEEVETQPIEPDEPNESITSNKNNEINETPLTKPKKPRTDKQLEAFKKAQAIRDANTAKRKQEQKEKEDAERKIAEEKIVKKAIAIKKKEIKKQAVLDEISDDDTPIQKIKEIAQKKVEPKVEPIKVIPQGNGVFAKINFF